MSKTPEQIANLPPEEKRAYLVELLLEKARKSKSVHPLSHNQHSMWFLNQLAPEISDDLRKKYSGKKTARRPEHYYRLRRPGNLPAYSSSS